MTDLPRVLVATPTTNAKRYMVALWVHTIKNLTYKNYDILVLDNSDDDGEYAGLLEHLGLNVIRTPWMDNPFDQLTLARNTMREYAIRHDYDYLLSLESDVIPPCDVIERMLARGKPYLNTVQWNHILFGTKIQRFPALCRRSKVPGARFGRFYTLEPEDLAEGDMILVERGHLGCTLISTDLLRKIVFRHDEFQWDDNLLCDDLIAMGVDLWCDTTIPIFHVSDGTTHYRARDWRKLKKGK